MEPQFAPRPVPEVPPQAAPTTPAKESEEPGILLSTFAHEGRFWDIYLEFVDDPRRPDSARARFCYVPTDKADHEEAVRTAVIVIEQSFEEAVSRARSFDEHQLGALLRSCL